MNKDIVAQMIGKGLITATGVLNPSTHVPFESFMAELSGRGITTAVEVHNGISESKHKEHKIV